MVLASFFPSESRSKSVHDGLYEKMGNILTKDFLKTRRLPTNLNYKS